MKFLKHLYEDLDNYLKNQEKIQDIYQVFVDFYGEDNVDLQNNFNLSTFKGCLYDTLYTSLIADTNHNLLRSCPISKLKHLIAAYQNNKDIYLKRFLNLHVDYFYCYIIVYFPKITITNEYNENVDIEEVYVRVPITFKGKMANSFEIIRAKYSYEQYITGYMHSHAHSGISGTSTDWRPMCLGSGPLVTTTHTLKNSYDIDIWRLFCLELDEYLKVESVAGVPYIRMNRIGDPSWYSSYIINGNRESLDSIMSIPMAKSFLKFLFHKLLVENSDYFSFRDKSICLALSNEQFAIVISKYFIEYYNSVSNELDINGIIIDCMVKVKRDINGTLKYELSKRNNVENINSNNFILCFKGKNIHMKVDILQDMSVPKDIYLLKPKTVNTILNYLINIVNYGNTKEFTTNNKIPYFL